MKAPANKFLYAVAAAVAANALYHTNDAVPAELTKAGLVEGNPAMKTDAGTPYRLTAAGVEYVKANPDPNAPANTTATGSGAAPAAPAFVFVTGVLPKVTRGGGGGDRGSKYPFDRLPEPVKNAAGELETPSFFIAAKPGMKSPSKSYGSIVSTANKKWAKATPARKFTTRSVADGGAAGYGPEHNGKNGVAVHRIA